MKKRFLSFFTGLMILLFVFSSISFGQTHSRSITAWFNNIKMTVDGRIIETHREPFFFENTLYVPMDDLSDRLLLNTTYDEGSKTLKISTNGTLDANIAQYWGILLQQRGTKIDELNKEITRLEQKLLTTEKELNQYKYGYWDQSPYYQYPNYNYPYQPIGSILEMQSHLRTYYSSFEDFPNTIYLSSIGSNVYRVTVTIQNNYRSLASISPAYIENWIKSMEQAIRSSYNSNARIEGYILDYNYYSGNRYFMEFETINNQLVFYYR